MAVVVAISGGEVDEVTLETSTQHQGTVRQRMSGRGEAEFAGNIHVSEEAVEYRILAGDAITQRYRLESRPRPHALAFHKTFRYPDYAQLPVETTTAEHGDLVVLEGTQVRLAITLDQPAKQAELRIDWADDEQVQVLPLSPVESSAGEPRGSRWAADVPVTRAGIYKVHLVAQETGFENLYSPRYEIRPQPDLIPRAGFVDQLETTLLLPPNEIVALKAMAEDDLPLVSLEQAVSVNGREWETLPLDTQVVGESGGRQVVSAWQWDLLGHELKSGDQLLTKLIATDRRGSTGESIPLRIVVAAPDFDPDRHRVMEQKSALYDQLASFATFVEQQQAAALELIEKLRQEGRDEAVEALDRTTLLDLCTRQRSRATALLEQIERVTQEMPGGADALDLDLTGRAVTRLLHDRTHTAEFFIGALRHAEASDARRTDLDRLRKVFESSVDDAKHVASHYQWLAAHNFVRALAGDFDALLRQQQIVVDNPNQTWQRLHRQQTVVVNQLLDVERLIRAQRDRLPTSMDNSLMGVLRWCEEQRPRLEAAMESEDQLRQLQAVSKTFLSYLERQQRVDSLDGGLPSRVLDVRKDLESRAGNACDTLVLLGRALQRNEQLTREAVNSQDSQESEQLQRQAERWGEECQLQHRPNLDQLRCWRALTQSRRDSDAQYAADLGLTQRAVEWQLLQKSDSKLTQEQLAEVLFEIAPAYRILEAGHKLAEARGTMNLLLTLERWQAQSLDAHIEHPRQWDALQQAWELASGRLREAKVPDQLVGALDGIRWSDDVREAGRKIGERRWQREVTTSASHELIATGDRLEQVAENLQPTFAEARAVIAKYAPTIPQLARLSAQQVRELEQTTTDVADRFEQSDQPQDRERLAELRRGQQDVNQQLEDLFDALIEDANKQDLLEQEQRERARDADDSIALVQAPASRMNRAMQQAQNIDDQQQQAQQLSQAAEQQERTAQALDLVAEHFGRLDKGQDVAQSREMLRQFERAEGLAREMDQQFQDAQQLAEQANQDAESLMQQLEAELQRNPAMQQALSEISQKALADARDALEYSARDEHQLQQRNEESDEDFKNRKRELADQLRKLSQQAAELARGVVLQADQAAQRGRTPPAHEKLTAASQQLNQAANQAGMVRNEQLLREMQQLAAATKDALGAATQSLRGAKEKTAEGKDERIHKDAATRDAAQRDAERQRAQFHDERKRNARNATRQAEDAVRSADRRVRSADSELRSSERRLQQAQQSARERPEDEGRRQIAAQRQQQRDQQQRQLDQAKEQQALAQQQVAETRQRMEQLERTPMPPLGAANPSTQLADQLTEEAIKVAEELHRQAEQLAGASQFADQLQPPQQQLASAQREQGNVTEDVSQTAQDVQRAGRHERRLQNTQGAEQLSRMSQQIADVAQNEATTAQQQLGRAAEEAEGQPENAGNQDALSAQQALATSEAALQQQAEQLGSVLADLEAAAEGEGGQEMGSAQGAPQQQNANSAARAQDSAPESGQPSSFSPDQMARGQQLARTLDELDRQQAAQAAAQAAQSGDPLAQPSSAPPSPLAQAAQAQQAAMAAARRQAQRQAMAAMTQQNATQSTDTFSDPATRSQFQVTHVPRQENEDWGKLRARSAENLTRGSTQSVAQEYRESVEAYFRVLAERSRTGK